MRFTAQYAHFSDEKSLYDPRSSFVLNLYALAGSGLFRVLFWPGFVPAKGVRGSFTDRTDLPEVIVSPCEERAGRIVTHLNSSFL